MKKLAILLGLSSLIIAGCATNQTTQSKSLTKQTTQQQSSYFIKMFDNKGNQLSKNTTFPVKADELEATVSAACKFHVGKGISVKVYQANGQEVSQFSTVCR